MSNLEKTVDLISEKDLSKEQKAAVKLVLNKKQNLFIQGSAGSGKSTFIKYLQVNSNKNIVLCISVFSLFLDVFVQSKWISIFKVIDFIKCNRYNLIFFDTFRQ